MTAPANNRRSDLARNPPTLNSTTSTPGNVPYSYNLSEYFLFLDRAAFIAFCDKQVSALKSLDKNKAEDSSTFETMRNKAVDAWADIQKGRSDGHAAFNLVLDLTTQTARRVVLMERKKEREAPTEPQNIARLDILAIYSKRK